MAKSGSSTQIVELTLVRLDPCGSTDRESADAAADAESSVRAAAGGGERGSDVEVLMSTVPELDDDGLVCGIVCFLQDCTEIKRLQQEATQHAMEQVRLRAIEENLAVTFHELRNPLNGCVGFQRLAMESLEHALRLSDGGDRASPQLQSTRADVEQALLCADHAVRFLQTMASTHRLFSMGVGEACPTLVSLRQMTASAATVIKPQLRPGVALDLQLPPEGLRVHIDETRMGQVIINLAQNASRFTSQGAVSVVCSYDRGAGSGGDDADAASAADGHGDGDGSRLGRRPHRQGQADSPHCRPAGERRRCQLWHRPVPRAEAACVNGLDARVPLTLDGAPRRHRV